jgi:hypothetical protein
MSLVEDMEIREWSDPCPGCDQPVQFPAPVTDVKLFEGKYWHSGCLPAYAEIDGRFYQICEGCSKAIRKNRSFLNGVPYHWAELRDSGKLAKATHYCRDCFSYLTLDKVTVSEVHGERWRTCGVCGQQNLKWLGKHGESQENVEVVY